MGGWAASLPLPLLRRPARKKPRKLPVPPMGPPSLPQPALGATKCGGRRREEGERTEDRSLLCPPLSTVEDGLCGAGCMLEERDIMREGTGNEEGFGGGVLF